MGSEGGCTLARGYAATLNDGRSKKPISPSPIRLKLILSRGLSTASGVDSKEDEADSKLCV